ncbi:hypothetical protein, partial [Ralstonia pseudosolanacearum]
PAPDSPCGKLLADVRQRPTAPPPGKVYRSGQTGRAADGSPKDPAAAPARQPALPLRDPTTAGG